MQQSIPHDPPAPPIIKALIALSKSRMDAYRDFFKEKNDNNVLSYYLWSQALASAFSPLIGFVEIALRNAIHRALSFKRSDGMLESSPWYDQTQQDHTHLKGKTLLKVKELLYDTTNSANPVYRNPQPTPDRVISELSFGVWSDVLQQINGDEAAIVFLRAFSNHPKSKMKHWSYYNNRKPVIQRVKRVQLLRNRICHYEPIWKPHFLGIEAGRSWSFSVKALRTLVDELIELLDWISPDLKKIYSSSFANDWLSKLCTTTAVFSFLGNNSTAGLLEKIVDPRKTEDKTAMTAFAVA